MRKKTYEDFSYHSSADRSKIGAILHNIYIYILFKTVRRFSHYFLYPVTTSINRIIANFISLFLVRHFLRFAVNLCTYIFFKLVGSIRFFVVELAVKHFLYRLLIHGYFHRFFPTVWVRLYSILNFFVNDRHLSLTRSRLFILEKFKRILLSPLYPWKALSDNPKIQLKKFYVKISNKSYLEYIFHKRAHRLIYSKPADRKRYQRRYIKVCSKGYHKILIQVLIRPVFLKFIKKQIKKLPKITYNILILIFNIGVINPLFTIKTYLVKHFPFVTVPFWVCAKLIYFVGCMLVYIKVFIRYLLRRSPIYFIVTYEYREAIQNSIWRTFVKYSILLTGIDPSEHMGVYLLSVDESIEGAFKTPDGAFFLDYLEEKYDMIDTLENDDYPWWIDLAYLMTMEELEWDEPDREWDDDEDEYDFEWEEEGDLDEDVSIASEEEDEEAYDLEDINEEGREDHAWYGFFSWERHDGLSRLARMFFQTYIVEIWDDLWENSYLWYRERLEAFHTYVWWFFFRISARLVPDDERYDRTFYRSVRSFLSSIRLFGRGFFIWFVAISFMFFTLDMLIGDDFIQKDFSPYLFSPFTVFMIVYQGFIYIYLHFTDTHVFKSREFKDLSNNLDPKAWDESGPFPEGKDAEDEEREEEDEEERDNKVWLLPNLFTALTNYYHWFGSTIEGTRVNRNMFMYKGETIMMKTKLGLKPYTNYKVYAIECIEGPIGDAQLTSEWFLHTFMLYGVIYDFSPSLWAVIAFLSMYLFFTIFLCVIGYFDHKAVHELEIQIQPCSLFFVLLRKIYFAKYIFRSK